MPPTCEQYAGIVPWDKVCEGEDVMVRLLHCSTHRVRLGDLLEREEREKEGREEREKEGVKERTK